MTNQPGNRGNCGVKCARCSKKLRGYRQTLCKPCRDKEHADRAARFVGQIYVRSWGYDQTNIDCFQVVELRGDTIVLKEIANRPVPGTDGHMCCRVTPAKGQFLPNGQEIKFRGGSLDFLPARLTSRRASYALHHPRTSYYCSWYA